MLNTFQFENIESTLYKITTKLDEFLKKPLTRF